MLDCFFSGAPSTDRIHFRLAFLRDIEPRAPSQFALLTLIPSSDHCSVLSFFSLCIGRAVTFEHHTLCSSPNFKRQPSLLNLPPLFCTQSRATMSNHPSPASRSIPSPRQLESVRPPSTYIQSSIRVCSLTSCHKRTHAFHININALSSVSIDLRVQLECNGLKLVGRYLWLISMIRFFFELKYAESLPDAQRIAMMGESKPDYWLCYPSGPRTDQHTRSA